MPFSELTRVLHSIDCRNATVHDMVRVTLNDSSALVFRLMPEFSDYLEDETHVRLHLDKQLSANPAIDELEERALPILSHFLPRRRKKILLPSMVHFFCWSDNYEVWGGGEHKFEVIAWIRLPDEPLNYRLNGPFSLSSSMKEFVFFRI